MKLPARDKYIFGQCPVQDDLVVVICEVCGRNVKLEAFEQHYRLRHDRSTLSSGHRSSTAAPRLKSNQHANVRQCRVQLTRDDLSLLSSGSSVSPTSGRSSSAANSHAKQSTSPSPVSSVKEEPMDDVKFENSSVVTSVSAANPSSVGFVAPVEEDESEVHSSTTTSNVISIPDTEPLPHSMSKDLMAMVGGDISTSQSACKTDSSAVSTTSPAIQLQQQPRPPSLNLQVQDRTFATLQPPLQQTELKKPSPVKKSSAGRVDRKPMREYHPDKHCGVWDNESKRHCTRALTCKSHSVLLKRKIEGRSKSFDELVAEHKAVKEAQALAAAAAEQMRAMPAPPPPPPPPAPVAVTTQGLGLPSPSLPNVESLLNSMADPDSRMHPPGVGALRTKIQPVTKGWVPSAPPSPMLPSREADENLHYTTDHPKPLALCTFGSRRTASGVFIGDRSQLLTRKVVRMALAKGGLKLRGAGASPMLLQQKPRSIQTLQPRNVSNAANVMSTGGGGGAGGSSSGTSNSNYLVNYSVRAGSGGGNALTTMASSSTPTTARVNLATLAPGTSMAVPISIAAVSESTFKTDIQDFKGGIKFELGRKIKHILPSGSEVSK